MNSSVRSYIVSGVGFLGAGVIFKDGASVRGLNTAATIWCSAAIGALCGLGAMPFALLLAAAVLLTNMVSGHWRTGFIPCCLLLRPRKRYTR